MASRLEKIVIDGNSIWVEVDELALPVTPPVTPPVTRPGKTRVTSNPGESTPVDNLVKVDLVKTLTTVIGPVHAALRASAPEEVTVELSLGLKGEVGVFVAKSEGSASLKITVKWKFPAAKPPDQA